MYIVLSGVHGIGKTTIAREIAQRLGGILLSEVIDDVVPPPVLGKSADALRTQLWFVRQMILKEAQMADPNVVYVSDRGWSDIVAYSNVLLDQHGRELFRSLFDRMPKRLPDVHIIVHAPIEVVVERIAKRNRSTLSEWSELDREYLDSLSREFVAYHDAYKELRPVYRLDAEGTIEENCAAALNILEPHLAPRAHQMT